MSDITKGEHLALAIFYGVNTLEELVEAQQKHIESLQAKLPKIKDELPKNYRQ